MKLCYYKEDIFNVCMNNHLTVDTIFEKIKEQCPNVWRSTIYRNVEDMVKEGKLKKITGIWTKAIYEAYKEPHAHLIDEKTGEVLDIEVSKLNIKIPDNIKVSNFDIKIYWEFTK